MEKQGWYLLQTSTIDTLKNSVTTTIKETQTVLQAKK
jgi:hypothetical protein